MSLKIRLTRRGAKKRPFYAIVVADVRAPRDGRFIEKIGTYNPMLAKDGQVKRVVLDIEKAKAWMAKGALMPCSASAATRGPGRPSSAKVAAAGAGALSAAVRARSSSETMGRGAADPRDRPVCGRPEEDGLRGLAGLPELADLRRR